MRFTDEIIFVKRSSDSKYDPDLGEWVEGKPERTRTEANVTDIGTDRSVTIFGSVEEGAKVIGRSLFFLSLHLTISRLKERLGNKKQLEIQHIEIV